MFDLLPQVWVLITVTASFQYFCGTSVFMNFWELRIPAVRSGQMLCLCVTFCNFQCLTKAKRCITEYVYELEHFDSYCH